MGSVAELSGFVRDPCNTTAHHNCRDAYFGAWYVRHSARLVRTYAILYGGCVLICVPWRSDYRCSVFSCRVALARIVPVPRMDREERRDRFAQVLRAWPKDCALAVSSISIRIRKCGLILCTILVVLLLRVRQRFVFGASSLDHSSFHGSSNRTISFCQFALNDRRFLFPFRKCNDTNRASCSIGLYPHRVIV